MARVTQSDLARELGVSPMTVSLALRGHRSISAATRQRVLALASKRGFRTDPILSELGRQRWKRANMAFHGTVGFLVPVAEYAKRADYHEGFLVNALQEQLAPFGYALNVFGLDQFENPTMLAKVLQARGITGLVHTRLPSPLWVNLFRQSPFISVGLNYGRCPAPQHAVCLERFPNWFQLWTDLAERGYQRPGFIAFDEPDAEDFLPNEAGRLQASRLVFGTDPLEPLRLPSHGALDNPQQSRKLVEWVKRVQPDCLIGFNEYVTEWALKQMPPGWKGGVCCWCLTKTPGRWSGFIEELTDVTKEAVQCLHNRLRDGIPEERGPAIRLIISRPWHEGDSLPRKQKANSSRRKTKNAQRDRKGLG